jgi:hypothetical protein
VLCSHRYFLFEHFLQFPNFGFISHGLPPFFLNLIPKELDINIILLLILLILLNDPDLLGRQLLQFANSGFISIGFPPFLVDLSLEEHYLLVACLALPSKLKIFVMGFVGELDLCSSFTF